MPISNCYLEIPSLGLRRTADESALCRSCGTTDFGLKKPQDFNYTPQPMSTDFAGNLVMGREYRRFGES
jgi:hypothetical protein